MGVTSGAKLSKVLKTQGDRPMKAPPRVYRPRNSIDDGPDPVPAKRRDNPTKRGYLKIK